MASDRERRYWDSFCFLALLNNEEPYASIGVGNVTKSAILQHANVGNQLITRTKRMYISGSRCTCPF